jgi:hypothetical protein
VNFPSANVRPPHRTSSWRIPGQLMRRGTQLLDQQSWYWGCDVRRPQGNLLLEYGFTRSRLPENVRGSSRYVLESAPGTQLILWGFGVFLGRADVGGLFLQRLRFEPLLTDCPALTTQVWQLSQLPALRPAAAADRPRLTVLLGDLLSRLITYELTVHERLGPAYREDCRAQWSRHRPGVPGENLVTAWQLFAGKLETLDSQAASGVDDS